MKSFQPDALLPFFEALQGVARLRVALSGGLDSTVLLHALHALREAGLIGPTLDAIHVHHGLSPDADAWSRHCVNLCSALGVPLRVREVSVERFAASGLEAAARHARYAALEQETGAGDCLLMAHHADDQAETLLLQLVRGSGPHGLAAMPAQRQFGGGRLARPLLPYRRQQLAAWATTQGLDWVEDESNRQARFDRNFLRLQVVPLLEQRRPGVALTLSRSARLCGEATALLDELAAEDWRRAATEHPRELTWSALSGLSQRRRRNLLRYWIAASGFALPSAGRLEQMAHDFWSADPDRQPSMAWGDAELHRYRDRLFLMERRPAPDPDFVRQWDLEVPLDLPGGGRLVTERCRGAGLSAARVEGVGVEVRLRRGGERCRPQGRNATHTLKKLLQELGVPPWQRDRIPLLYVGDELVAVADRLLCEGFAAGPDAAGWILSWEPEAR